MPTDPVIVFDHPERDAPHLTAHSRAVITEIARRAQCPQVIVTCLDRDATRQAEEMYTNLEAPPDPTRKEKTHADVVQHQHDLYAAAGDAVIAVYEAEKAKGSNRTVILLAMVKKIIELGPEHVSKHCLPEEKRKQLQIVDVSATRIHDSRRFDREARAEVKPGGLLSHVLGPPTDPCHHLEIPQPVMS